MEYKELGDQQLTTIIVDLYQEIIELQAIGNQWKHNNRKNTQVIRQRHQDLRNRLTEMNRYVTKLENQVIEECFYKNYFTHIIHDLYVVSFISKSKGLVSEMHQALLDAEMTIRYYLRDKIYIQ